ncbi:MAG: hypothetical protein K0Q49_587 [Haloplasmataceae bacterium]|nr:hypothetical protein [Haloplasmataceae bacterium]
MNKGVKLIDFDKTLKINMLFDFYSPLFTEKQIEYMELYYNDDLSLAEIAEHFNISRNAVHDTIQRTIKQLEIYEEKLNLLEKFNKRKEKYDKIKTEFKDELLIQYIEELENLE